MLSDLETKKPKVYKFRNTFAEDIKVGDERGQVGVCRRRPRTGGGGVASHWLCFSHGQSCTVTCG